MKMGFWILVGASLIASIAIAPAHSADAATAHLTVTPHSGKPSTIITVRGSGFRTNARFRLSMFCTSVQTMRYGAWSWKVRTAGNGTFARKLAVPRPLHTRTTTCKIYAPSGDNPFGLQVSFHILPG